MDLCCFDKSYRVKLMKIMFMVLAVCLAIFILYFLFNVYFIKENKLNNLLNLKSKKDAVKFLLLGLLLVPLLGLSINSHMDQMIAESKGYSSFEKMTAEAQKAESFDLTLEDYEIVMSKAKKAGFNDYTKYNNDLLAKENGYENYPSYYSDLQFARSYGFPLSVYKKAKAESDSLNYEYFDDYLIYKEKSSLSAKLNLVSDLSGNFNIENVPLGIKLNELTDLVGDCKVDKLPSYSFPVTKTLAPRNKAYVNHFFPATKNTSSGFGLTAYSLNFSVMPGLDLQAISKYEMKCETKRYDLWFLNSDDSLVMYEKSIKLPQRGYDATLTQIEKILSDKCDAEITIGLEMTFEENGERKIKNFYCKNFQNYILATVVDGPVITGVRQDPTINIGYLNDRLWKKYINNLHAIKNKKRSSEMSKVKNEQSIIEDRI